MDDAAGQLVGRDVGVMVALARLGRAAHGYRLLRTVLETAEALDAVLAELGFAVDDGDVSLGTQLRALAAADTCVAHLELAALELGQQRPRGTLDGIDALLSTVQMPSGIPVATVAINGGVNAALLAAQILAVSDEALAAKLDAKRAADAAKVLEKDAALQAELCK